jgi:hypothetical protein
MSSNAQSETTRIVYGRFYVFPPEVRPYQLNMARVLISCLFKGPRRYPLSERNRSL